MQEDGLSVEQNLLWLHDEKLKWFRIRLDWFRWVFENFCCPCYWSVMSFTPHIYTNHIEYRCFQIQWIRIKIFFFFSIFSLSFKSFLYKIVYMKSGLRLILQLFFIPMLMFMKWVNFIYSHTHCFHLYFPIPQVRLIYPFLITAKV